MTYKTRHQLFGMFHWALKKMFDTDDVANLNEIKKVLCDVWDYMYECGEIRNVEPETSETT